MKPLRLQRRPGSPLSGPGEEITFKQPKSELEGEDAEDLKDERSAVQRLVQVSRCAADPW